MLDRVREALAGGDADARGHAEALRAWAAAGADIVMGGHIHLPYTLALDTTTTLAPSRSAAIFTSGGRDAAKASAFLGSGMVKAMGGFSLEIIGKGNDTLSDILCTPEDNRPLGTDPHY